MDVELIIKGSAEPYVKATKDAQKATQEMHNISEQGMKREKGLIQDIEDEIKRLGEARKKAYKVEDIEKYNQKIAEAKRDIQEYEQAGVKAEKQTVSFTQNILKWATGILSATAILKKLVDAVKETTTGINFFNTAGAVTRQVLNDIVTGAGLSTARIMEVIAAQKELNALRIEQALSGLESSKHLNKYQELYVKSLDTSVSSAERLNTINEALLEHDKAINIEMRDRYKQFEATLKLLKQAPDNEKLKLQVVALAKELQELDTRRDAETKRLQKARFTILKEDEQKTADDLKKIHEYGLKLQKAFAKDEEDNEKERQDTREKYNRLAQKLIDDYDKSMIDSLKGKEKLEAQREFGIKQIKELRDQLAALGPLSEDQKKMLQTMADNVWKEYFTALAKGGKATPEQKSAISKALLEGLKPLEGLQKSTIETAVGETPEEFSIWKLLGIDPESDEGQEQIRQIQDAADRINQILEDSFQERVDIAQRQRELIESQIDDAQRSFDQEIELYKAGYASNVTAKENEVAALKKQREQAIKDEEKAVKNQQRLDTIRQTASLITAAADTFKAFPGPLLPIAIAIVAATFAAFVATKAKAAAATKLAEGGSGTDVGIVTGKRHSEGGERFLDHVEVERGEAFGVLSREATGRYGKVFHEMVSSFNKNEMPEFISSSVSNNVRVDNNGPNTRLDRVIREQEKMNQQLKQSQVFSVGKKIIRKSGNRIRIIG